MRKIKAKVIVEMANAGVSKEAQSYLEEKGVYVIPGIIANAGGVVTSYFEWVQCRAGYWWEKQKVLTKLEAKMKTAAQELFSYSRRKNFSLSQAAYALALEKLIAARV